MTDAKVMDEMASTPETTPEAALPDDAAETVEESPPATEAATEGQADAVVVEPDAPRSDGQDENAASAEDLLTEGPFSAHDSDSDDVDDGYDDEDDEEEDIPHLARISFDDADGDDSESHDGGPSEDIEPAEDAEIPLELIDHDALWVVRRLRAKGHEAYLTGGCVRDLLLGRQPKDFDVATAAHPDQVKRVFRNCRLIGRRFRLAHIYFPNGKVIETATFRANPLDMQDDLPEDLLVERDNVFGTVEEDARRRDLTINGLFYDPLAGKVLDFVDGRQDLDARLIRTIGDPDIRFQEDPVRILRAIKFATRLDFEIESQTLTAMRAHVADLARCAAPRLLEELHRLLGSGKAAHALRLCEQVGVLDVLVPELMQALHGDLDLERFAYGKAVTLSYGDEGDLEIDVDAETPAYADDAVLAVEDSQITEEADDARTESASLEAHAVVASGEPEAVGQVMAESQPALVAAEPTEGELESEEATDDVVVETESAPQEAEPASDVDVDLPPTPVVQAPVFLSSEVRHARYSALLASLDAAHARDAELSSAVSFATLLLAGFEAYQAAGGDAVAWLDEVTGTWTERIRLTRHDRETIRYLCRALAQLDPSLRRGAKARHLVSRPWFREALLLHTLSLHAAGESLEEIARWKVVAAHYQKPFKQPKKGERQARPRRMRRSRRGGGEHRRGRRR